jgi:hypothetical protein
MGEKPRRLKEKGRCLRDHRKCPAKEKLGDGRAQRDFQAPRLPRMSCS